MESFGVEDVRRILAEAATRRNSARWAVALALGLRQGEVQGLKWEDVDLDRGVIRVRRGRQRPKCEHGCGGKCGRKAAGYCPARRQVRADAAETKSRARDHGGWSTSAMATPYQHITDPVRRDVAQRLGGLLWDRQVPAEDEKMRRN